jgi:hypothetical protein
MYLTERQRQFVEGHQAEGEGDLRTSLEWSVRVAMVIGFFFVLTIEGLLLIRVFVG